MFLNFGEGWEVPDLFKVSFYLPCTCDSYSVFELLITLFHLRFVCFSTVVRAEFRSHGKLRESDDNIYVYDIPSVHVIAFKCLYSFVYRHRLNCIIQFYLLMLLFHYIIYPPPVREQFNNISVSHNVTNRFQSNEVTAFKCLRFQDI